MSTPCMCLILFQPISPFTSSCSSELHQIIPCSVSNPCVLNLLPGISLGSMDRNSNSSSTQGKRFGSLRAAGQVFRSSSLANYCAVCRVHICLALMNIQRLFYRLSIKEGQNNRNRVSGKVSIQHQY